ncbi:hypothetical protein [Paenibacillus woosongensis]|uniref:DUF2726 domain-containing protein n=1 Tax=Paenibacillus woosongensis TaxID=307580 RepID=A0ABQ4MQ40_9BACL|nr:hypothetical protein [Paenibacillus woosongensis]GIP58087.1 hypothetical protein J15TS10_19010 [Paenibacillus woosongensis]
MSDYTDGFLMVAIAGIALLLLYRGFRIWLRKPFTLGSGVGFEFNEDIQEHPAVDLLESAGYKIVSDKLKVPLAFRVEEQVLHSRLYIDYVVKKHGEYYLVRRSRERRLVEWTGAGLRREILPYLLLYPDCAGVLYIDTEQGQIKEITLSTDSDDADEASYIKDIWRTR